MKVSVAIITYNQEKFIAQAIESVLMQKVNFDYEIVIGDDCSTDRTREILVEFEKKYPAKIRPLFAEKNFGDYGRTNFVRSLEACTGDYIAILDGDDYWTKDFKLQWQADFLDKHPQCSISFHFFSTLDEKGKRRIFYPPGLKRIYTLKDLLLNNFIGSSTVMFRNALFGEFPEWYHGSQTGGQIVVGDWPLHVLNAQHGDIGCIHKFMAVKRLHNQGVYSKLDAVQQIKSSIESRKFVNKQLNFRYDSIFQRYYALSFLHIAKEYIDLGDRKHAREYLLRSMAGAHFYHAVFSQRFFQVALKLYFPWPLPFLTSLVKPLLQARLRSKLKNKIFPKRS